MRVNGDWFESIDGIRRPTVEVKVAGADGVMQADRFLVDTGADRTVLSEAFIARLGVAVELPPTGLGLTGIGGRSSYVVLKTTLELTRDDGGPIQIHGEFAAFTDGAASETGILGRDVFDHFDVIVSRRCNAVVLLAGNHQYSIT